MCTYKYNVRKNSLIIDQIKGELICRNCLDPVRGCPSYTNPEYPRCAWDCYSEEAVRRYKKEFGRTSRRIMPLFIDQKNKELKDFMKKRNNQI